MARFTNGAPALVERAIGRGRVLVFASDFDDRWNTLPRSPVFVPLLHEMARYLTAGREQVRECLVSEVPPGVRPEPGVVTVSAAWRSSTGGSPDRSRTAQRVAVNVDPRESETAHMTTGEFASMISRLKGQGSVQERIEARQQEDEQKLWRWLVGATLAVLLFEGLLGAASGRSRNPVTRARGA
jgi:hypothetical protein